MRKLLAILLLAGVCSAQEIRRPTAEAAVSASVIGCSGGVATSTSMPLAYDAAGLTTSSVIQSVAVYKSSRINSDSFITWQTPGGVYSDLTLNVNALSLGSTISSSGDGTGQACIAYSLDGGHVWGSIICDSGAGWPQQTFATTLSPTTDLALLRVGVCTRGSAVVSPGDVGSDQIRVYDVWTSGTTASAPTGNGSSAGSAHRGVVIAN